MVHPGVIEARLNELGFKCSRWFKPEIGELKHILMEEEKIVALACGRYFGSFALLVATDLRLLLIDKRTFFMTVDDTRYDMISEINYNQQSLYANVTVYTINKTHKFTSVKHRRQLRELTSYVQRRVWEFRQQQPAAALPAAAQPPQAAPPPPAPVYQDQSAPAAQPQPVMSAQPADYHADAKPFEPAHAWKQQTEVWREQAGHVAHMIGSSATRAAHHSPDIAPRSFHPYLSGSLMTRSPFNHGQQTTEDY